MSRAPAGGELLVAETFGPTVQGEGPSSGRRAAFIRLSRCNLACRLCDTPYTWDTRRFDLDAESTAAAVADLLAWALAQPVDLIVITGGEPLLQQRRLLPLVTELAGEGRRIEVETNGTIVPLPALLDQITQFNVSPKLSGFGAGIPRSRRIKPEALRAFADSGRAVFKFVVSCAAELDEVGELATEHRLEPVFVMPEGRTAPVVCRRLAALADPAIARGFHLTARLHILAWGDQRGR